jgi:hypothetical protein
MAANSNSPPVSDPDDMKKAKFVGEEGEDENITPSMELAAAITIGLFALLGIYLAFELSVPDSIFTAPGLLPAITALTLLAMAIALGIKALKAGASASFGGWIGYFSPANWQTDSIRSVQLVAIIVAYIFAVDWMGFDIRIPIGSFDLRFSSYELFSIIALTWILKLFWQAPLFKCFAIATGWSLILATVFRYGFRILLPGSG